MQSFLMAQGISDVSKITETSLNSYVLSLEKNDMSPASVSRYASIKLYSIFVEEWPYQGRSI